MKNLTDLGKISESLNKSAIYNMSLGSKELFHSNFIAWLLETYPDSIKSLGLEFVDGLEVHREKKNVDIVLTKQNMPDQPILLLENKFKDAPNSGQLIKYKKTTPGATSYILLTLVPASFDAFELGWTELRYGKYVANLASWLETTDAEITCNDRTIIKLYCEMVSGVCAIANEYIDVEEKDNTYWFVKQELGNLEKIRFVDTLRKYQANKFAEMIRETILNDSECSELLGYENEEEKKKKKMWIEVSGRLFNKTACTTASIIKKVGSKLLYLEVQIQGNQYRHLIGFGSLDLPKGRSTPQLQIYIRDQIEKTDKHQWLFGVERNSFCADNWIGDQVFETGMQQNYAKYAPNVIYQYINIAKTANADDALKHGALLENILRDVKLAISLLQSTEYTDRFNDI